jgi:hypothetical protein
MTTAVQDSLTPRCLTCDYPLLSLPEHRCPECGRAFDPADPRTMRTPRSPGKVAQFLLKPPGWPTHLIVGLTASASIFSGAAPGSGYVIPSTLSFALWIIIIPAWVVRVFLCLCLREYFREDSVLGPFYIQRWIVTPILLGVVVLLLAFQIPLYAAFWVSRSAMDSLAQEVVSGANSSPTPKWVGLFYADDIKKTNTGMRFRVPGASLIDLHGFTWSNTQLPQSDANGNGYLKLDDHWYTWNTSY